MIWTLVARVTCTLDMGFKLWYLDLIYKNVPHYCVFSLVVLFLQCNNHTSYSQYLQYWAFLVSLALDAISIVEFQDYLLL